MKITILSKGEIIKAVVDDGGDEITATYYRRASGGVRGWIFLRTTTVAGPLHLALDTVHAVVNHTGLPT